MQTPISNYNYHMLRFQDGGEADAFVRALQRFLSSPKGSDYIAEPYKTEAWASGPLAARPLEIYLSDGALAAAESVFAPVPIACTRRGDELPGECRLVMRGADLTTQPM